MRVHRQRGSLPKGLDYAGAAGPQEAKHVRLVSLAGADPRASLRLGGLVHAAELLLALAVVCGAPVRSGRSVDLVATACVDACGLQFGGRAGLLEAWDDYALASVCGSSSANGHNQNQDQPREILHEQPSAALIACGDHRAKASMLACGTRDVPRVTSRQAHTASLFRRRAAGDGILRFGSFTLTRGGVQGVSRSIWPRVEA